METYLRKIADKYNGDYQKEESTWYSWGYLPLETYYVKFVFENWNLILRYEYKMSNQKDRHLVDISLINSEINIESFRIYSRSLIGRILNKISNFNVKCVDKTIKLKFEKSIELLSLFKIVENSSEFDPMIEGWKQDNGYKITIGFNTMLAPFIEINTILTVCEFLIQTLNLEKGKK